MSFGPQHYVPVLKVKRGEKVALQKISANFRSQITPLLEIVERKADKDLAAHLDTAFKELAESVHSYPRCFLDAREVAPDGPEAAMEVFQRASSAGIVFAPVTGISRTADVDAALSHRTHGLALRLTRSEFEKGNLATAVEAFLGRVGITPNEVDLILDLGPVEDLVVDGVKTFADAFMRDVPYHERWRTFTLSACAFPVSMGAVDRHSHNLVERVDWIAWRDHLHPKRHVLPRLPTFSDYAIQHPLGVEGFDPRIMQVSASVRYTLEEAWLLIKGESTRSTPSGMQFPELATRLVYGHLRTQFAGPTHCDGCRSMKEAADGASGFGSAEAWRRLGTVHHISRVMQGLSSLLWT